jgi:hypothetical protein
MSTDGWSAVVQTVRSDDDDDDGAAEADVVLQCDAGALDLPCPAAAR